MLAVQTDFDNLAIIAPGDDARSIGSACENSAGVNRGAVFRLRDEQ